MQTINLDQVLKLNDDSHIYEDGPTGDPQVLFVQDHFEGPQLEMFRSTFRGTDLYSTYSVGGWEAGNSHRTVCHGPLIEGPYAWLNENATVLTAHRQTPRERIRVEPGDHLIIRGTEYEIVAGRHGERTLKPVTE